MSRYTAETKREIAKRVLEQDELESLEGQIKMSMLCSATGRTPEQAYQEIMMLAEGCHPEQAE